MSPRAGLDGCKNPGFYTGNVQLAASRFINKQTVQQTSRNILLLEKLTVAQLVKKTLTSYGTKTFTAREKKNQLDATEWFIALKISSTFFRHFYAYHQELETICVLLPPMVCSAWLLVVGGRCRAAG